VRRRTFPTLPVVSWAASLRTGSVDELVERVGDGPVAFSGDRAMAEIDVPPSEAEQLTFAKREEPGDEDQASQPRVDRFGEPPIARSGRRWMPEWR
jgi:hypothetical protein